MIKFDYSNTMKFIDEETFQNTKKLLLKAHKDLHEKTGEGNEYTGWVELPKKYCKNEVLKIKEIAKKIRNNSEVVIIIGIGGSYLGAKAGIEALLHSFYNELPKEKRNGPAIYFAGKDVSSVYMNHLLDIIKDKDFSINVISKSGTTTEPAITFRILKKMLQNKYGKEGAKERIIATTDKQKGALKKLADDNGYETFIVPDDIGGRYSVFTPVGLLPLAIAGLDIDKMLEGYEKAYDLYINNDFDTNECYQYATIRNCLYKAGKEIEIMVNYEPKLHYFSEWYKQLFGESEGKDKKGIFPASVDFTTDLHSMGQYLQDGNRNLSEIVLRVNKPESDILIEADEINLDGLNYLEGKTVDFVNQKACEATIIAHITGGVPIMTLDIPKLTEYYFGQMVYFFEKACAISGYILGVNPFNQPGVEEYKKNMFKLLGKPE